MGESAKLTATVSYMVKMRIYDHVTNRSAHRSVQGRTGSQEGHASPLPIDPGQKQGSW